VLSVLLLLAIVLSVLLLLVIVLSVLLLLVIVLSGLLSFGHCVVWSSVFWPLEEQTTQWSKDRRTDNTMVKRQKNRQHNDQKKKYKMTNNDLKDSS
jgi:hypothetical protein